MDGTQLYGMSVGEHDRIGCLHRGAMIFGINRDLDPDGRIDMHEMAPDRHAALPRREGNTTGSGSFTTSNRASA